jgi:xanthosine utilization system XapX-like protein
MSIVGEVALAVIALVVLIGLVVGVRSIPDVRRYLKIRSM